MAPAPFPCRGASHARETSFTFSPLYSGDLDEVSSPDDALDLCREGVTKLFIQQADWPLNELFTLTQSFAARRAAVAYYGWHLVEVSAPGISRTHTLAVLCRERGILAGEVLAFGGMALALERLGCA